MLSCNLTEAQINAARSCKPQKDITSESGTFRSTPTEQRMGATIAIANQLANSSAAQIPESPSVRCWLRQHCRKSIRHKSAKKDESSSCPMESVAELREHDWQSAYALWRQKLVTADVVPNSKQQTILDAIHARCVHERQHVHDCTRVAQNAPPFLKLIHGLPGSGKSRLLTWI